MKKWNNRKIPGRRQFFVLLFLLFLFLLGGCGQQEAAEDKPASQAEHPEETGEGAGEEAGEGAGKEAGEETGDSAMDAAIRETAGLAHETAKDGEIDFALLQEENPEIFAWIQIPDTGIDYPVLQSFTADDYYETHNAYGETDAGGALYIEAANLNTMCDFNTVIHGKAGSGTEEGHFFDLYRFADPDFFDSHETVYLYLPDNVLTYEVFAAYERENTSLLRTYDFTYQAGCRQFLDDLYATREMGMHIRAGWEEVTPYHFLITLTTEKDTDPDRQYVVIAALIEDAAGTIDRVVVE